GSRLAALSFMDENFDYETKESAVHDIEELTKNKRIPQAIRKAVQQSLEQWLAVDHGTFWEDQRKAVTAKKALSDAQTAIIGKASDLVLETLDKAGEPEQNKVLYSIGGWSLFSLVLFLSGENVL
ncbi:hypothetical protein BGZ58_005161, partial [Dissophora ornata]